MLFIFQNRLGREEMIKLYVIRIAGSFLLILSFAGIVHGARAAAAQVIYKSVRYRDETQSRRDPEAAERRAHAAHRLYPYNYYFCIWTAENCWYYRNDETGHEVFERVGLARKWCDRGLELNERKSQLRLLKARLIARTSPAKGAEYWQEYVDWHFWDRYNHAALVELYADAGNLESAMEELKWVKRSKHYKHAGSLLQVAWKREVMEVPGKE